MDNKDDLNELLNRASTEENEENIWGLLVGTGYLKVVETVNLAESLYKVKILNKPYKKIRDAYRIEVKDTREAKELILKHPDIFIDFEIIKGKMDDVFLAATGKRPEEN